MNKDQTKQSPGGNTAAHEAEILGMTPGIMEGKSVVVISLRPNPNDFRSVNYAISGVQFKRMIRDGTALLERSEQLRNDPEPDCPEPPPFYLDFNPEDQPPKPKGKGKGKGKKKK
jgi:hypothetical protein